MRNSPCCCPPMTGHRSVSEPSPPQIVCRPCCGWRRGLAACRPTLCGFWPKPVVTLSTGCHTLNCEGGHRTARPGRQAALAVWRSRRHLGGNGTGHQVTQVQCTASPMPLCTTAADTPIRRPGSGRFPTSGGHNVPLAGPPSRKWLGVMWHGGKGGVCLRCACSVINGGLSLCQRVHDPDC